MLHRYQLAKPGSNPEIVTPDFVLEAITLSWFTVCQKRGYAEDVEISVQEIKASAWIQLLVVSSLPPGGWPEVQWPMQLMQNEKIIRSEKSRIEASAFSTIRLRKEPSQHSQVH